MKRNAITIYSVAITAVFIFSVAFLIVNLASEYSYGQKRAELTVENITSEIKKHGTRFDMTRAAGKLQDFQGLYLYKEGEPVYFYPQKDEIAMNNTNMVKVFTIPVKNGGRKYTLKAAVYILRPSSIFYYARVSFIIILIATVLTIALLTYLFLTEKKAPAFLDAEKSEIENDDEMTELGAEADAAPEAENDGASDARQDTIEETAQGESENVFPPEENAAKKSGAQTEETTEDTETAAGEDSAATENAEPSSAAEPDGETAEADKTETTAPENAPSTDARDENKKDFFSPITGFGWEDNFQFRLENELVRAASSEADLSLFIIKITGLHFTDDVSKNICAYLLEEFQFRDMVFEFGDDGFAVIKTDTPIARAEQIAGAVHAQIAKIIENTPLSCFIGISSRSVRMLSAERLILEAEEALNRSVGDPSSPITGFHVDIDKYREFLNNN
ncbi:MAG: GGDEF domain-containing protein [Treponema sp.]